MTFGLQMPLRILLATAALTALPACRRAATSPAGETGPRSETLASGAVLVELLAEPRQVALDRDMLITLRITAPSNLAVRLPNLADRLQGFTLNGAFDREPRLTGGRLVRERCLRLTPVLTAEYRLAPMALSVTDQRRPGAEATFIATRPVLFDAAPVLPSGAQGAVGALRGPVWIYPEFKTVAGYLMAFVLAAGLIFLLWKLSRRLQRAIKLRRMSPRERALFELAELLARDLVGKGEVREFYYALTLIVRRYIERAHAVRAPEQTTEEFLDAVSRDPRFTREIVQRLRTFLQAADLVKYAALRPDAPTVDRAAATARDYIEHDAMEQNRQRKTGG
jgi:hypothetical protein